MFARVACRIIAVVSSTACAASKGDASRGRACEAVTARFLLKRSHPVMAPPPLLGRARELDRVRALLDDPDVRLVVLRGPPGVGKSTLARALVASLRADGVPVVTAALDACGTRNDVLATLASALGDPARSDDPRVVLDRVARALDDRRCTLALDGVDGARGPLAELLRDLLDGTEHARAIVCAWQRLDVADERVVPLAALAADDAAQLFSRHLARLAPDRQTTGDELRALVARTGGLPLAVEVVAARVASLGAAPVLAALDAHGLAGDALDRALDAAWRHLGDDDRRSLGALSVLRARFDVDTAAAMLARPDAHDALARLVDASLVVSDDTDQGPRFALLDGVRDHAARRLDDRDTLARRHARTFAALRTLRDDATAWTRLADARADLVAAWRWSLAHEPALAAPLALALDPLLVAQGPVGLHREVLARTLDGAAPHTSTADRIDLALALGRIEMIRGRARAALAPWMRALDLATSRDDDARLGWCTAYVSVALRPLGRLDEARDHGARALDLGTRGGDLALVCIAHHALACVCHGEGDLDGAGAGWERALATATIARAPRLEGILRANLARLAWDRGDAHGCARHAALAREALARRDDRFHLLRIDVLDALLAHRDGRHREALDALDRALDTATAHDDLDGALEAREALCALALDRDDRAVAAQHLGLFGAAAQVADDVAWPARIEALRARLRPPSTPPRTVLRLTRDGRTLHRDGVALDLTRRGPLRRVLLALFEARLARPGAPLDTHAVLAAGWPGERMFPESGAARVYMAVRRLRVLGLDASLVTVDGGYALDPRADAAWLDAPDCQPM